LSPPPDFEPEDALVGGFDDGGADDESDLLLLLQLLVTFFGRTRQYFVAGGFNIPELDDMVRDECGLCCFLVA